jgi:hypothetical protein
MAEGTRQIGHRDELHARPGTGDIQIIRAKTRYNALVPSSVSPPLSLVFDVKRRDYVAALAYGSPYRVYWLRTICDATSYIVIQHDEGFCQDPDSRPTAQR